MAPKPLNRKKLAQLTEQNQRGTFQLAVQFGSFVQMGFFARLRWLFTGYYDESLSLRNAQAVASQQAAAQGVD
jgi:hypothetical protein